MKRILFLITITASLFIIKDLLFSIYSLWNKNDLLLVAQKELANEQKKHLRLQAHLKEVQKPAFIESEARNKLFLVKPGEQVVIVPQSTPTPSKKANPVAKANWEQWLELFF